MAEADETLFYVIQFITQLDCAQLSTVLWLSPVFVFLIVNCIYNRLRPGHDDQYTACSDPSCARCQRYSILRQQASDTLQALVTDDNKEELSRIIYALEPGLDKIPHHDQQCRVFHLPGLRAKPFWSIDNIETQTLKNNLKELEESAQSIASEYDYHVTKSTLWTSNTAETGQWSTFYLYNQGKRMDENCAVCPRTSRIVENLACFMKGCVFGNVLFSIVDPGTLIAEHYGPTNTRLRCHLGSRFTKFPVAAISVPGGVTLTVRGRPYTWSEGKCLVFDDSFLHAVDSRAATEERAVLILDLWHPDITPREKEILLKCFPAQ